LPGGRNHLYMLSRSRMSGNLLDKIPFPTMVRKCGYHNEGECSRS
jgi:hypothetical protein